MNIIIALAFVGILISLGVAGLFMVKGSGSKSGQKKYGACADISYRNFSGLICVYPDLVVFGCYSTDGHHSWPTLIWLTAIIKKGRHL